VRSLAATFAAMALVIAGGVGVLLVLSAQRRAERAVAEKAWRRGRDTYVSSRPSSRPSSAPEEGAAFARDASVGPSGSARASRPSRLPSMSAWPVACRRGCAAWWIGRRRPPPRSSTRAGGGGPVPARPADHWQPERRGAGGGRGGHAWRSAAPGRGRGLRVLVFPVGRGRRILVKCTCARCRPGLRHLRCGLIRGAPSSSASGRVIAADVASDDLPMFERAVGDGLPEAGWLRSGRALRRAAHRTGGGRDVYGIESIRAAVESLVRATAEDARHGRAGAMLLGALVTSGSPGR